MPIDDVLTICSVSYNSWDFLSLNWDLVSRLNSGNNRWKWVIVDNNPKTPSQYEFVRNPKCIIKNGEQPDGRVPIDYRASLHHGNGLNKSLSYIDTRFALFLDPDFFVVFGRDWIANVIDYMLHKNLKFFGVPWHPKWYIKYRYFPCPHCLFIDLRKVPPTTLDFTPDYRIESFLNKKVSKRYLQKNEALEQGSILSAKPNLHSETPLKNFKRLLKKISNISRRQKNIGCSRDTGYKIYQKYGCNPSPNSDGPIPVYKPNSDVSIEPFIVTPINRFFEFFLPDSLTYLPKRRDLYSYNGFKELGYPDVDYLGWEEFLWNEKPFGFHLRSQNRTKRHTPSDAGFLKSTIERFTT